MSIIDIKWTPSKRELKWFGLLVLLFFGLIGGLVWWVTESRIAPIVLWTIGAAVCALYYALRPLRVPLYRGWMTAVYPIGWTVSHLVLGTIYYLVITPIGWFNRLFRRDPMRRRIDRQAQSYWIERRRGDDPSRYVRQS